MTVTARSTWPLFRAPRSFGCFVVAVNVAVFGVLVAVVVPFGQPGSRPWVLVSLMATAALFEELAARAARLQLRLSLDLKRDMTSVWAVAAAVGLEPSEAVVFLVWVLSFIWFRQQRPAGEPLFRKWFNASTVMVGCLVAGVVARSADGLLSDLPWRAGLAVAVLAAMSTYTVVNRSLVSVGLLILRTPVRRLIGTADDNVVEFATLCLGGLVAVAVVYEPWLVLLTVVPMVALQRGAVVRELENFATTDAKTGLLNAVALEHLGQREIARAARERQALSILIIDIDLFKRVNDRHGHLTGDAVLAGVAKALAGEVREYDTLGRFGGEEFVAVLPTATESVALAVAERLRWCVAELRISDYDDRSTPAVDDALSVSIGVACHGIDGQSLSDLLFAADAALYRAKAEGRNRVVLAERGGDERPAPVTAS